MNSVQVSTSCSSDFSRAKCTSDFDLLLASRSTCDALFLVPLPSPSCQNEASHVGPSLRLGAVGPKASSVDPPLRRCSIYDAHLSRQQPSRRRVRSTLVSPHPAHRSRPWLGSKARIGSRKRSVDLTLDLAAQQRVASLAPFSSLIPDPRRLRRARHTSPVNWTGFPTSPPPMTASYLDQHQGALDCSINSPPPPAASDFLFPCISRDDARLSRRLCLCTRLISPMHAPSRPTSRASFIKESERERKEEADSRFKSTKRIRWTVCEDERVEKLGVVESKTRGIKEKLACQGVRSLEARV